MKRRTRLTVERLDTRNLPASFGVPWADPTHLTASFVPDGTQSAGAASNLNAALDLQMPRAVWQGTILRALQTWADAARINVGLVSDSGVPIGAPGATQADPRFGDIRFAGLPMTSDALGEAVPPDPVLSGTLAGDVFFNTTATFDQATLYKVALHEIGHALGMDGSTNPHSIMFDTIGTSSTLIPADVRSLRAMYGAPAAEKIEPPTGNPRFPTATRIPLPAEFDGSTPLFAFGTINGPHDVDTYLLRGLTDDTGAITIRLQTAGISLAMPRLTVYDGTGTLLARVPMAGLGGGMAEFTIVAPTPGHVYYLRVDPGSPTGPNGRYGIAVSFNDKVQVGGLTVDQVLRGQYDTLAPADLAALYDHPGQALYNQDGSSDDSAGGARNLPGVYGPLYSGHFQATGSLTDGTDVNFYRIRAPLGGRRGSLTLVARLRAVGPDGTTPQVTLLDAKQNLLPVTVLVNGAGEYTVEASGADPGRRYYLRIAGAQSGNYTLDAAFRSQPVPVSSFASGTADSTTPVNFKLYAGLTQLFGFTLTANGPAGSSVRLKITDAVSGSTVFDLTAPAGTTLSDQSTFLAPGEYNVQITSIGSASPVGYAVAGTVLTDPLGPQPGGGTLGPKYPDPNNPGGYLYPNPNGSGGIASINPFLWVLLP
jgi:hypothetical protein